MRRLVDLSYVVMVRFTDQFSLRLAIPPTSLDWDLLMTREKTEGTGYISSKPGAYMQFVTNFKQVKFQNNFTQKSA